MNGRRFTHLELKKRVETVSVLITDTDRPADGGVIEQFHGGETLSSSGFRVGTHAIFVVSELKGDENVTIARAIEPAIRRHVESAGV